MVKKELICLIAVILLQNLPANSATVYKQGNLTQAPINVQGNLIELLVDYSPSMAPWINQAKSILGGIIRKIPRETYVALRVFGQDSLEIAGLCKQTKLVNRPYPASPQSIINGLNTTRIGSTGTPIAMALQKTIYSDFAGMGNNKKKIILVTDGGENCGGDPCAVIRNAAQTRKDIQIDVIVIGGGNQLKCLSDYTGGRQYDVSNVSEFNAAMDSAFKTTTPSPTKPATTQPKPSGKKVKYEFVK